MRNKRGNSMRKIIVGEFLSLDGVMEDPGGAEKYEHGGWTNPYYNAEIQQAVGASMARSDALLLGRVTYQAFEPAFSGRRGADADIMNSFAKYVVSTTLKKAEWNNSTLIKGNVAEEVAKLKQQPGKDIAISGSGTLVRYLMQHDLIDEYSLLVYPVVLGSGKRLFGDTGMTKLKLVEAKPLSSGVVQLSYARENKA